MRYAIPVVLAAVLCACGGEEGSTGDGFEEKASIWQTCCECLSGISLTNGTDCMQSTMNACLECGPSTFSSCHNFCSYECDSNGLAEEWEKVRC